MSVDQEITSKVRHSMRVMHSDSRHLAVPAMCDLKSSASICVTFTCVSILCHVLVLSFERKHHTTLPLAEVRIELLGVEYNGFSFSSQHHGEGLLETQAQSH